MVSEIMDHVDRDDAYRLILLTTKCMRSWYIDKCVIILLIDLDSMYIMYTYLPSHY